VSKNAIQTWTDFATSMVNEHDLHKVAHLIAKLNQDLSEIDERPDNAAARIDSSAP